MPPQDDGESMGARVYQGHLFEQPTLVELAQWYESRLQRPGKRESSRRSEGSYIRQALEYFAGKGVERPDTADWKGYLDWRRHPSCPRQLTACTTQTHRAVIQKMYKRCAAVKAPGWFTVDNPLDLSVLDSYARKGRDRPRSLAEPYVTFPLLLAQMPDPVARALLEVLRWQGLRIQEALGIVLPGSHLEKKLNQGRFLDVDKGTLTILYQRSRDRTDLEDLKTEYSKGTVRLVEPAAKALREALRYKSAQLLAPTKRIGFAARNFVFPYFKDSLDGLMARHREVAPADFPKRVRGVDGGDAWHVYRHTFATEHWRNWPGDWSSKRDRLHKLLRHRDAKTTDSYLRALLVDVVEGDDIDESIRRQLEKQNQAIAERSGKGLSVVRRSDT